MALVRLDKLLTESGAATRSEARRLIMAGRVRVDGVSVTKPEHKLDNALASVTLDGHALRGGFCYLMLHKPAGVVSATEDREEKTVLDLLPEEYKKRRLFPVGRLDKDTTGLLLLTNDGDFSHVVTAPRREISKRYEFTAEGSLGAEDVQAFAQGLALRDGSLCQPALLELDETEKGHGFVTLSEGKYHQVKRMLASRGASVRSLKRLSVGGLSLDGNLQPGDFRELTEAERNQIFHGNVTE